MCGIAGLIKLDGNIVTNKEIKNMIKVIKYRGPDDEGYYIENNIGMGHCRLSIIDLTDAGHQPMKSCDNSLLIVYNGEIYNFVELRKELETLGYKFKSNTDTEVILYSYKEWGENCVNRFNGDWAFAILDKNKKELFCSRDRFGVKPFYYFFDGKVFAFASEIKSLLELGVSREVNPNLIYDFLIFGILEHTDKTFFKNVKKLPPASWLKLNQKGEIVIKKFWDFKVSNELESDNKKIKQYDKEFLELFMDSIKIRLRSDVPVGSCLSGGLDSSAIVCAMSYLLKIDNIPNIGEKIKTFSACYEEKNIDERNYIEEVITKTNAEKNYIFPKPEDFLKEIDDIVWHQEEPFGGTSIFAQWKVLKKAREKVKVLLDGQGGDENLCGYRKFYFFYLKELYERKKYSLFFKEVLQFFSSLDILKTLNLKSGLRYINYGNKLFKIEDLINHSFIEKFKERKINFNYQKNLGNRIKEDITKWSLPVLLRFEDKNSAASSIETRLPFLDYRLVEKIGTFPFDTKINNGWTKFILRNSLKGILPEKIRLRKSKLGFATPQDSWMRHNLYENVKSTFKNLAFIQDYVNKEQLLKSFDLFSRKQTIITGEILFRFYSLELWGRKFIIKKNYKIY